MHQEIQKTADKFYKDLVDRYPKQKLTSIW